MSQDQDVYKFNEPPTINTIHVEKEEEEEKQILNELFHYDVDDPSISDIEHSAKSKASSPHNRLRTKSKSSGDVLLKSKPTQKPSFKAHRRHSESSSESHSSEYRKHKSTNRKIPILIPLNVNGKNIKHNQTKKASKNTSRRTFGRSILSKYKSKRSQTPKINENEKLNTSSLGISGPVNVQHVIHVEWDPQSKAYKVCESRKRF